MRILAITLLLIHLGCTEAQTLTDHAVARQSWEKSTRVESAWDRTGYPVIVRYSHAWTFKKSGQEDATINIQGIVALTYHNKNTIDIARGIYFFIVPSKDSSTFGDAYVDLDELPDLVAAMDRFSKPNAALELRGDAMVGMSFKTKGMFHFRTGSPGLGFVIGARKAAVRNEETSVSDLTREDLAEFKVKLELAKQWAEKQAP